MLNEFYCLAVTTYLVLDYGLSCSSRSQGLLKIPTVRLQFKRSKRAHTACLHHFLLRSNSSLPSSTLPSFMHNRILTPPPFFFFLTFFYQSEWNLTGSCLK